MITGSMYLYSMRTDNVLLHSPLKNSNIRAHTGTQYTIYLTPFPGMEVSHIKYRYWISSFSLLVYPFILYCAYMYISSPEKQATFWDTPIQPVKSCTFLKSIIHPNSIVPGWSTWQQKHSFQDTT
jgi:hypothetical protein